MQQQCVLSIYATKQTEGWAGNEQGREEEWTKVRQNENKRATEGRRGGKKAGKKAIGSD